jgi:aspartyl-tRNA(Asn)/glutamyl-tRNA(Gln) amidotransferase subunit C
MPRSLTVEEVERIAALAHLELTGDEKRLFAKQLADILEYARQLQAVDTTGVPATAHVTTTRSAERDDQHRPSLPVAEAVANAPDGVVLETDGGGGALFRVPRVIG